MKRRGGVIVAILIVISAVVIPFQSLKHKVTKVSIQNPILATVNNPDIIKARPQQSRVEVVAEVRGVVRKVFVEKNSDIELDKVIAMISRVGNRKYDHDYVIVRAPGAGILSRVVVNEGDTVERGEKLFEMLLPGE